MGTHLARLLSYEKKEITIIDLNAERLQKISNQIDVAVVKGSATSYKVLKEAEAAQADLFIAVTEVEEINLTASIIAKQLGAKKTVARITNEEFLRDKTSIDLAQIGIDELISPELLAAREVKRLLRIAAVTDTFEFDEGLLSLIGIIIDQQSALVNCPLAETARFNLQNNFIIVAVLRGTRTLIPNGETVLQVNDHVYFIAQPNGIDRVLELTGKREIEIKNMMILGGSKAGYHTARKLSPHYKIKLIERDKEKCFALADQLPDTLVINGDGRNVDLLEEEGLGEMDAFIALTGDSETNIISCLVAKDRGVKKTVALVENADYIQLSQNIGVDTMINKKLIAANFIFRYIREGDVISIAGIHGVEAEILEYEVNENCKIAQRRLRDLNFPKEAVIGGVIRDECGYIALGDFLFKNNDRVVVLSKREALGAVEEFFK